MEKTTPKEWQRVGEAVVVWSGWGRSAYPSRDEARLAGLFGGESAAALLPLIRELEEDFYSSDARHVAADLAEMADMSSAQFKKKYPEIPDDAIRALAWCYTYDYK